MPRYDVEMTYTAQTTYSGTVTVTAANEEEAEEKALEKAAASGISGWEANEEAGDFEVNNIEELE